MPISPVGPGGGGEGENADAGAHDDNVGGGEEELVGGRHMGDIAATNEAQDLTRLHDGSKETRYAGSDARGAAGAEGELHHAPNPKRQ